MKIAPRGIYPGESHYGFRKQEMYQASGEFRCPKKGEFYLSGALIQAYRAPNDLNTEYWIAKPTNRRICSHCGQDMPKEKN